MNTHLFLFGGGPPFTAQLAARYAQLSSQDGGESRVAILFVEREGWEQYMPKYTDVLKTHIQQFFPMQHYGIDEQTGAYFKNSGLELVEGQGVHQLVNDKWVTFV